VVEELMKFLQSKSSYKNNLRNKKTQTKKEKGGGGVDEIFAKQKFIQK
jgi:hypothetical protein